MAWLSFFTDNVLCNALTMCICVKDGCFCLFVLLCLLVFHTGIAANYMIITHCVHKTLINYKIF